MYFSVIITFYNEKDWLERSVNSVLNQTFKKFELILVDDGSNDSSDLIADKFAKEHKNVKVIHKNNEGLVAARKTGIFEASADYIVYVDADDYLEPNALQTIFDISNKHPGLDMIIYSFIYEWNNFTAEMSTSFNHRDKTILSGFYNKEELIQNIYPYIFIFNNFFCNIWRCCFKTSLLRKYYCKDNCIVWGEDICCFLVCLTNANNVYFLNKVLYRYNRNNPNSITRIKPFEIKDNLIVTNYLIDSVYGIYDAIDEAINFTICDICFWFIGSIFYKFYDYYCLDFQNQSKITNSKAVKYISSIEYPNFHDLINKLDVQKSKSIKVRIVIRLIKNERYRELIWLTKFYFKFYKKFFK